MSNKEQNRKTDKDKRVNLNKLVLHPSFKDMVTEIKKVNITITEPAKKGEFDFSNSTFPPNGKLRKIEELAAYDLNAKNGQKISREYDFTGYDESILNYMSLEGSAAFTAHSLVIASKEDYIPVNFLSFYFYTRSENLKKQHSLLTHVIDPNSQSNRDYVEDRNLFLGQWSLDGSISFIDGPLIGGNITTYTLDMVKSLHKQSIIPIFIVKNSDSNLVTDNIAELRNQYNSDMHWSYHFLSRGQRTNFFLYIDESSPKNAKVFCYIKAFNLSPQRIEFHVDTYKNHKDKIDELMDLTYYLFLAHGDKKNPQVRPIAVAEKFARDVLQMSDSYNLIKSSGLIPTMNQERFGG